MSGALRVAGLITLAGLAGWAGSHLPRHSHAKAVDSREVADLVRTRALEIVDANGNVVGEFRSVNDELVWLTLSPSGDDSGPAPAVTLSAGTAVFRKASVEATSHGAGAFGTGRAALHSTGGFATVRASERHTDGVGYWGVDLGFDVAGNGSALRLASESKLTEWPNTRSD